MFERRARIIRDGTTLSYDYVPDKLLHRDRQMAELERMFSPLALDQRACSAFLFGGVGTGKTVTAKRFCLDMAEYFQGKSVRMGNRYVNCRIKGSEYAVMLEIVRYFDPGFPERGFALDELVTILRRNIESQKMAMVVTLDEADYLLKGNSKDLIYQLSRFSEGLSGGSLSLILVSQVSLAGMIDEASMSTFRRANMISFDKYTTAEIREIMAYRAEIALERDVLPSESLDLLARQSEEYGDARYALEILERSAHIAESEGKPEIDLDCVRTAASSIYSDASEVKLQHLDFNKKLALLAIARAIKSAPSISITKCEKTYAIVC
ncbi:MAG: AAA family ATPase, partial [archaeon]|nr:AAA family ATPase [archaeon]